MITTTYYENREDIIEKIKKMECGYLIMLVKFIQKYIIYMGFQYVIGIMMQMID